MTRSSKKPPPPPLGGAGPSKTFSSEAGEAGKIEELIEGEDMVVQVGEDEEAEQEESTLPPPQEDSYRSVKKNRKFGRYELLMEMS